MPEFRQDPISGQWVIIAENRAGRPDHFAPAALAGSSENCPFCAGREPLTPEALHVVPAATGSAAAWRIRVIPNKYPAVTLTPLPLRERLGEGQGESEISNLRFQIGPVVPSPDPSLKGRGVDGTSSPALGSHEIIVESPDHLLDTTELSDTDLAEVLLVYRDRLLALKRDPRLACGMVFKNVGAAGGATLEHLHSQLVALPTVPDQLRAELDGAARWRKQHGGCAYCDLIDRELTDGVRMVAAGDAFVALCPWAARTPYETWILPRAHQSHYEESVSPPAAGELASLLRRVIVAIEQASGRTAYNYVLHNSPFDMPPGDHYHWHIEVIPRVTRLAGFEFGTGWYINPVVPEAAAERLRKLPT